MKKSLVLLCAALLLAGCMAKKPEQIPVPETEPTTAPAETAAPLQEPQAAGEGLVFSAQTLDGETVSEAFFADNDLNMVNIWASWCPPCVGELGELGELYTKLPQNVGFLSLNIDEEQDMDAARALLSDNNCSFTCIKGLNSPGIQEGILSQVMYIPSTVFFDRQGNQVGELVVGVPQGADVAAAYMDEINSRLSLLP